MNQYLLLTLLFSICILHVNSAPKKENHLNRNPNRFNYRHVLDRWLPRDKWVDKHRNHNRDHKVVKEPEVVVKPEVPVDPKVPEVAVDPEVVVDPKVPEVAVDPVVVDPVVPEVQPGAGKKIVCYIGTWANYRFGNGRFVMEDIDANKCTHIIYGFAKLVANKITPFDPWLDLEDDWGLQGYKRFVALKSVNPSLKALIAIGGWNEGSGNYSVMASSQATRAVFVQSVMDFLQKFGFDGLDFDWEYPSNRGGVPEDKQNFVQVLRELRTAFGSKYLLTTAVSAGSATIESAYDIPGVISQVDFVNLMCYDFHGAWHDYTGHNAPLFVKPTEPEDEKVMNVNYGVQIWLNSGAPPAKLNMGMPLYGRTFTLSDPANNGMYAPTTGGGIDGPYTGEPGILGYLEICEKLRAEPGQWTHHFDNDYLVPYLTKGNQWVGYDDVSSIETKVRYILWRQLGGAMVWSLDTDDFKNVCGGGAYPLLTQIGRTLSSGTPLPDRPDQPPPNVTPGTPAPTPAPTQPTAAPPNTTPAPGTPPPSGFVCTEAGYFKHPTICTQYYLCKANFRAFTAYLMTCAPGTAFSQSHSTCIHANDAECPLSEVHPPEPNTEPKVPVVPSDERCSGEGIFRNGNECESFVECHENPFVSGHIFVAEVQYCPKGLVFDDKISVCNNRQNVERCNKVVKS